MERKIVVCIIGRTGAGKDTITAEIQKKTGWQKVVSYTDAGIRSDQKNGREHWFVTRNEMDKILSERDILAETEINGNRYCTTADQLGERSLYIIDPKGFEELEKRDGMDLIPVVITADRATRKARSSRRKNFDFDRRDAAESEEFEGFMERCGVDMFSNMSTPAECADNIIRHVREKMMHI